MTAAGEAATPRVWVLPDRRPGNASQCLGVAEALGFPYQVKPLGYTWTVRLANRLRGASLTGLDAATRAALAPPWPDIVIAAGRRAAPSALHIKQQSGGRCFLVHLMHPGWRADEFDLIALPDHDRPPEGPNLLPVTGAPHHATRAKLEAGAARWRERLEPVPRPRFALLIGGAWGRRRIEVAEALELVGRAQALAAGLGGGLLVTTSRRTPRAVTQAIIEAVTPPSFVHCWRRQSDNPYFGFLGLADAVIVTGDSVSMICEATATGRPVLVLAPPGLARPRQALFHRRLFELGAALPFDAVVSGAVPLVLDDTPRPPPLDAAGTIAAAVRARLGLER